MSPAAVKRARKIARRGAIVLAATLGHVLAVVALLEPQTPPPRLIAQAAIELSLVSAPSAGASAPNSRPTAPSAPPASASSDTPSQDVSASVSALVATVDPTAEPQAEPSPDTVAVGISVATAAVSASAATCRLGEWLQAAMQEDEMVGSALTRIPRPSRSIANALMLWDGRWVQPPEAGAGLSVIRAAILAGVRSAPAVCRGETLRGPIMITLNDTTGTTLLVVGSGQWRWDDLLASAPMPTL